MYVSPAARGHGVARAILAELEHTAVEAGYGRMVLETGYRQPEALALYQSAGYVDVPDFGYYADEPGAVHLGKTIVEEPSCPSTR
jgi:GNAT superfamily N-acetyltransferase